MQTSRRIWTEVRRMLKESVFFGVFLSLGAYEIGSFIKKKWNKKFINPLLISIIIVILVLVFTKIDYDTYYEGSKLISYLLTPATVCLAIPLYEQIEYLKKDWKAIIAGITAGVITSAVCILVLCKLLELDHQMYVTLLPKSITSAIGMGVSEELGGIVSITVPVIIVTGIIGSIIADFVLRIFKIHDPVAKGVGIGTSAHAIGTTRAIEMGEVEGAMSGLSIAVAGVITVVVVNIFQGFI